MRRGFAKLLAVALLTAALVPHWARAGETAPARKVILLIQKGGANQATDDAVARHLAARGLDVQLEGQGADPAVAKSAALVVISSTVSAKDVATGWRQLAVPLLTWENDLLDDLAMTGKRHDRDFGNVAKERYLWIVNAPHAMAAGLPAGIANVFVKQGAMSWGKPGLGASVIATIYGEPDKAAIFGYEKGATMDYEALAPARRVMFFMDNDSFVNLSSSGLLLFDAAVDWALAR